MRKLLFLLTFFCLTVSAQDTPNARQAKRIFTTAWNHIYGPEGAQFQYKINILGLYKEEGTSWNKGDKAKSVYKDTKMWNDGKTKYILREKKGVIEIHDPKVNKKDEKLQMFKFDSNSYNYSIAKEGDDFMVTLEAKPNAKVKMKKIEALLAPTTYYPKRLRIKVNIFWATITFANFKTGNIDDSIFNFPREKYKDYKIIDER